MLAMLSMFVFSAGLILAVATIAGSLRRHGRHAIELVRHARTVPDMREFSVTIMEAAAQRPAPVWQQLRRQPRRLVKRPAVRLVAQPRAAA